MKGDSKERWQNSRCDRCGKSTAARQVDGGDLFVLDHSYPEPIADWGCFCQRCIDRYSVIQWLVWYDIVKARPDGLTE